METGQGIWKHAVGGDYLENYHNVGIEEMQWIKLHPDK